MAFWTLLLGLAVLTAGADLLVRGASRLATAAGISPLVVGLTVVAMGTSAPELVVSVRSALAGQPELALGNVVGSNILNVLLILGLSAMIVPLIVSTQLIRFDVPLMIGVSLLVLLLSYDGGIGRLDGLLLIVLLVAYMSWTVVQGRREASLSHAQQEKDAAVEAKRTSARRILLNLALVVGGLVSLIGGAEWFTGAAVEIARRWGVSELIIGLTIVAVGTSLPEVATSIIAAMRGERDLAVGNVVGSNLFNLLCVLGITSLVSTTGVSVPADAFRVDIPVMVAVAIACLPVFFTGHRIARWEGALFFSYYLAYTAFLVSAATAPELSRSLAVGILGFVLPLTVITLAIGVVRSLRRGVEPSGENVEPTE